MEDYTYYCSLQDNSESQQFRVEICIMKKLGGASCDPQPTPASRSRGAHSHLLCSLVAHLRVEICIVRAK
jgi:hypothetical protein